METACFSNPQGEDNSSDESLKSLKDLEIEVFSSFDQSVDLEACKKIFHELREAYCKTKNCEDEVFRHVESTEEKVLDCDIKLQELKRKDSENERLFLSLGVKGTASQERNRKTQKMHSAIRYEFQRVKSTNDDLQKQVGDIKALNDDIVCPVLEKRRLELSVMKEGARAAFIELAKAKSLLDESKSHLLDFQSNSEHMTQILKGKVDHKLKMKNDPLEIRNNIEKKRRTITGLQNELESRRKAATAMKAQVLEEKINSQTSIAVQRGVQKSLAAQESKNSKCVDELASLSKALSVAQAQYHSLATERVNIEIKMREVNENLRHRSNTVTMQRKHLDRTMRLYLKKKRIVERSSDTIKGLRIKLLEDQELVKSRRDEYEELVKIIDAMKDDINIKVTRLLEQKNAEDDTGVELATIMRDVDEKENEIDRWGIEVKKLSKIVSALGNRRDSQIQKTRNIYSEEKEAGETTKLKSYAVKDMEKVLRETDNRIKESNALCTSLEMEKNEIVSVKTAASRALHDIVDRIQSKTMQLKKMGKAQLEKASVLAKERDLHESSKKTTAALRVDWTNARAEHQDKREEEDRQEGKINKARSTLTSLQRNVSRLDTRNQRVKNRSQLMSDQLDQKKAALHKLLLQANIYEDKLQRGEIIIQGKREDIRIVKIKCADIERHINTRKTIQRDIRDYRETVNKLQDELHKESKQMNVLSDCLENPVESDRWRDLGGKDLDEGQLEAKTPLLLQQLSDNKEQLLEKEILLEELSSEILELQNESNIVTVKLQPAMKKLNDCQGRTREITRSIMALVSELSMYQATALKLEEEKEFHEETLTRSRELIDKGQPPSDDAASLLYRMERIRSQEIKGSKEITDPRVNVNEFGKTYYPAPYALRTTAEPRPTAYIPDVGLELPKPYGGRAPFKPNDCNGSTMRHIRSPDSKYL